MQLTEKQIEKALQLSGDRLVTRCMEKIKAGQLTWEEMRMLCEMKNHKDDDDTESVARDIGLI